MRDQPNTFYNAFDYQPLGSGYPRPADDYRLPFQVDRDRVLYTSAFRRLQSKTQVFLAGDYDFYRTRLTHSLEVAQIGKSICHFLRCDSPFLGADYFIDSDLVEAAGLTHDLGHPPFGHAGERTLHTLVRPYGGFEGNAQTLRLVTETLYHDARAGTQCGINPTRAFVDSVLKYKTVFEETPDAANHFIYDEQRPILDFVHGDAAAELLQRPAGRTRNDLRSIECQIMDWADDTAYSLNDLGDGIAAGFLTLERIGNWAARSALDADASGHIESLMRSIREKRTEASLGRKIGRFIGACQLEESRDSLAMRKSTHRYRFRLNVAPEIKKEAELYKQLALDVVFRSEQLQQLDYKGDHILRRLFQVLQECYLSNPGEAPAVALRLLPESIAAILDKAENDRQRARMLCDYVSSMTDGLATRTYRRLFDADFGSIVDLVL